MLRIRKLPKTQYLFLMGFTISIQRIKLVVFLDVASAKTQLTGNVDSSLFVWNRYQTKGQASLGYPAPWQRPAMHGEHRQNYFPGLPNLFSLPPSTTGK